MALLAKWFHLQPSEMGAMGLEELADWAEQAQTQMQQMAAANS